MIHEPGPIARATARLLDWLSRVGAPGRLAPPRASADPTGPEVCLWPLTVLPAQEPGPTGSHGTHRLRVRYLVHAGGGEPAADAAVARFDRILASLPDSSIRLTAEPVTSDIWLGFGVPPQLGLYLDVTTQVTPSHPTPLGVRANRRPTGPVRPSVSGSRGAIPAPAVPATGRPVPAAWTPATHLLVDAGSGGPVRRRLAPVASLMTRVAIRLRQAAPRSGGNAVPPAGPHRSPDRHLWVVGGGW